MSDFAISVPPTVSIPVAGGGAFPVRRVYCIGRNYAAHAFEMGRDPDREPPFFFQKNPDDLNVTGEFPYPPRSSDVHHEAEVAVFLKSGGTDIALDDALDHVFGYALSLDITRRDLQGVAKKMGRPWEIGKAFAASAPVGPIHKVEEVGHPSDGKLILKVNGDVKQEGDLNQMIWKVPEMISYLSEYYTLAPGDVILSGAPAGVGLASKGDEMTFSVDGLGEMTVEIT